MEEPGGGLRMKPGNSSIKIYESAKKLLFLKARVLVKIYIFLVMVRAEHKPQARGNSWQD